MDGAESVGVGADHLSCLVDSPRSTGNFDQASSQLAVQDTPVGGHDRGLVDSPRSTGNFAQTIEATWRARHAGGRTRRMFGRSASIYGQFRPNMEATCRCKTRRWADTTDVWSIHPDLRAISTKHGGNLPCVTRRRVDTTDVWSIDPDLRAISPKHRLSRSNRPGTCRSIDPHSARLRANYLLPRPEFARMTGP